jgi:hypothetical protein
MAACRVKAIAMADTEIIPAPQLEHRPAPSKFERERRAFFKRLSESPKEHEGEYVAIHDGKLVGPGADHAEVALKAYADFGYVPIFVGKVTVEPPATAGITEPRLVTSTGDRDGALSVQYAV